MENLNEEMEKLNIDTKDSIIVPIQKDTLTEKDTKMDKNNTQLKVEDLDGLQMLRLPQEDNKTLLDIDIVSGSKELSNQQTLLEDSATISSMQSDEFNCDVQCFQTAKHVVIVPSKSSSTLDNLNLSHENDVDAKSNFQTKKSEKHKDLLNHVKFVLEGKDVKEDNETRANRHSEFVELKKRLEEEEKMYAGCALSEASNIDQIDVDSSSVSSKNPTSTYNPTEDIDSLDPTHVVVRSTLNEVINNFEEIAKCRQDSSPQENMKPLSQPQNMRYAMKDLMDDDGLLELQEYTDREGSTRCQCCCRKAGKQIDEGDENDVYMTNSSYAVLNVVCPVSGMPVIELNDPVRSEECEHIYDRASALNYIACMAKDGFCLCAAPGCHALLVENKLVVDNRLWEDIEELRQIKATMWESRMLQDFVNMDDSDDD